MITHKGKKREIRDLQRLLLSLGLMEYTDNSVSGIWCEDTQRAVNRLYDHLGWNHGADERWVTSPALAAAASSIHRHVLDDNSGEATTTGLGVGGGGSHTGGGATPE